MNTSLLESLGWSKFFCEPFARLNLAEDRVHVGRVIGQGKGHYRVLVAEDTPVRAVVASSFHDASADRTGFPTVGDWVTLTAADGRREATIEHVLPRRSLLQRQRGGRRASETQLIAANVDRVLVVTSPNEDFDLARVGRYLALANDSGAEASVVLTKTDLVESPAPFADQLRAEFPGVEVFAITQTDPHSLESLTHFFAPGLTTVLVGSSGVGKSSLTNWLVGDDAQRTQGLSAGSRGKHTTTSRDLRRTRFGGLVIDTPGMQDVADSGNAAERDDFADIAEIELRCKFTDCRHGPSPGCAITPALADGTISTERMDAYTAHARKRAGRTSARRR